MSMSLTVSAMLAAESHGPPLDYSFKELKKVTDILDDVPFSGTTRSRAVAKASEQNREGDGGDTAADGVNSRPHELMALPSFKRAELTKLNSVCLRLGNNLFNTLKGLDGVANEVLDDPARLYWLDVSHNRLTAIESVLLRFRNLKVLYFHGNQVSKLSEVDKLSRLDGTLLKVTLQANPIEELRNYRVHDFSVLPNLKKLDNGGITIVDRDRAMVWSAAREARRRMREG